MGIIGRWRRRRTARWALRAETGVRSLKELRRRDEPSTLSSLWRRLGWLRLLVGRPQTWPNQPGLVTVPLRRFWVGWGPEMHCWVADRVADRVESFLPVGVQMTVRVHLT
jgi:hypothetical protein